MLATLLPTLALALVTSRAADEVSLSDERKAELLLNGRVVSARQVGKGVTESWRVTLDDGRLEHDAHFQAVDIHEINKNLGGGRIEVDFVDSYRYNIAAYRLARLLGLGDMVPVSVERSWRGKLGAMTWWVDDVRMDENEMIEKGIEPPTTEAWRDAAYKVRLFNQLVYDTDRNRSNVLITGDWHVWMIDFTRAFRRWDRLRSPDELRHVSRELFARLKALDEETLEAELGDYLRNGEIEGLLARRDLIVERFETLAREHGAEKVFY